METEPGAFETNELQINNIGKVGLRNINNTCYSNAVIQCLSNLPDIIRLFSNGLYRIKYNIRQPPRIIEEFDILVYNLWENICNYIVPDYFYHKICQLQPNYGRGSHEDAMEFFLFLLDRLCEDCTYQTVYCNMTPQQNAWYRQFQGRNSVFQDLFYHQIEISQFCEYCQMGTNRFEMESTFMLPVPDNAFYLQNLINDYMADLVIVENRCGTCLKPMNNSKNVTYCPNVIVVVLKRYKQRAGGGDLVKQNSEAHFPAFNLKVGSKLYKLNSFIMHHGTLNYGHYTAGCYINDKGWYEFDDDIIRPINFNANIRKKAYAFFYTVQNANYDPNSCSDVMSNIIDGFVSAVSFKSHKTPEPIPLIPAVPANRGVSTFAKIIIIMAIIISQLFLIASLFYLSSD